MIEILKNKNIPHYCTPIRLMVVIRTIVRLVSRIPAIKMMCGPACVVSTVKSLSVAATRDSRGHAVWAHLLSPLPHDLPEGAAHVPSGQETSDTPALHTVLSRTQEVSLTCSYSLFICYYTKIKHIIALSYNI